MGNSSKKLEVLLKYLDQGELVLPEIQRDFVWKKKNIQLLFDSLYRELPIGSMLVWKSQVAVPKKKRKTKHGPIIGNFYGYLLDGQQRLTAIQLVFEGDEKYPLYFSMRPVDEEDPHRNRFCYASRRIKNDPWYIPVSDVLSKNYSTSNIIQNLKNLDEIYLTQDEDAVYACLAKLNSILQYEVGVIEFEQQDYRKATELFVRFNSTGRNLNKSDLASAELALQVEDLVSDRIMPETARYEQYRFTMPFLIRSLASVHTGKGKFTNPSDIWAGSTEKEIEQSWNKTSRALGEVIKFLTGTVRWDSDRWLPSINALIPLIYIFSSTKPTIKDLKLARKWLLLSGAHAYFSGSVYSKLDMILRKLKRAKYGPSMTKLWQLTRRELPKLTEKDFEVRRMSGGIMSLYISILRDKGAVDWIGQTSLEGQVKGHNAELQVHHFFPKRLLLDSGVDTEDINTFANYTIINKSTNLGISDEEPAVYIKKFKIKAKDLRHQCIPSRRSLWKVENYYEFLEERRVLLAKNANAFLK